MEYVGCMTMLATGEVVLFIATCVLGADTVTPAGHFPSIVSTSLRGFPQTLQAILPISAASHYQLTGHDSTGGHSLVTDDGLSISRETSHGILVVIAECGNLSGGWDLMTAFRCVLCSNTTDTYIYKCVKVHSWPLLHPRVVGCKDIATTKPLAPCGFSYKPSLASISAISK
jgi:hypothetical protein